VEGICDISFAFNLMREIICEDFTSAFKLHVLILLCILPNNYSIYLANDKDLYFMQKIFDCLVNKETKFEL